MTQVDADVFVAYTPADAAMRTIPESVISGLSWSVVSAVGQCSHSATSAARVARCPIFDRTDSPVFWRSVRSEI